jgi:hypothetical protein
MNLRLVLAVAMGLGLSFAGQLDGFALAAVADQDNRHVSPPREKAAARGGVCERELGKLVTVKPVRPGRSMRPPKKIRDAAPKYPEVPPGTVGHGMWLGEVLIDDSGKIAHVWPIREVEFTPPFPAFNRAIVDAIQQWEFERPLVRGKPVPMCMTVSVNIDWR